MNRRKLDTTVLRQRVWRIFVESVLSMSGIAPDNIKLRPIGGKAALQALANVDLDAAIFVGGADTAIIHDARVAGVAAPRVKKTCHKRIR
jgi:TRAP-type uncharacterized transport system substrate-binding protein